MGFVKKTWTNRISEYPNRRTINDGYVTKVVTVARDEGTITQEGDAFSAENMNDLETRIEDAIETSVNPLMAGDNINISNDDIISVKGFMTAAEAHALWASL